MALGCARSGAGSIPVQRWQYRWTENYGSKQYKLSNPTKEGQDDVNILAAKLADDGKTLLLKLEDHRRAMQMRIDLDIKSEDGQPVKTTIYSTINQVP